MWYNQLQGYKKVKMPQGYKKVKKDKEQKNHLLSLPTISVTMT